MTRAGSPEIEVFKSEIRTLYYQRTHICLWLGVVFFSLFSLLDFFCCREFFTQFFIYRLIFVISLLCCIHILRLQFFKPYAQHVIYTVMIMGAFVISLMAVELGGFFSGYYVGILLMVVGALSVLPIRVFHVIAIGLSMYLVYILTVLLGTGDITNKHLEYGINNTFFFFSVVGIAAVQSYDDLYFLINELRAKKSIKNIRKKLTAYTVDLEETVQQRLVELQESALKYQDLYNSIVDLVVLVDEDTIVTKINNQSFRLTGKQPADLEGREIAQVFIAYDDMDWCKQLIAQLQSDKAVRGIQLKFDNIGKDGLEVELTGGIVNIEGERQQYQFIIRDISTIKVMENELLISERLLSSSRQAAIFGLAKLAECRDDDTGAHLLRIQSYTRILCEELAKRNDYQHIITDEFVKDILHSSVLHDIGKVGIPDSILLKPASLTDDEFELMKNHCIYGSDTLSAAEKGDESVSFLLLGREIARSHHERWDGRGYPDGLSGNEIPLAARIIALADVYDALTSSRVYKPAFNHEVSKEIITKESGGQFDPRIVYAFLQREQDFKEARMQLVLQQSSASIG